MSLPQSHLIRTARRIHDQLIQSREIGFPFNLPDPYWHECQRLARMLCLAESRGWRTAAERIRTRLHEAVGRLGDQLSILQWQSAPREPADRERGFRLIVDELRALAEEFEKVTVDFRATTLSVQTEPILLEHMALGPFRIALNRNELGTAGAYHVIAVEPFPAASSPEVTHPHVQDEHLCEGEARLPIRRALEAGRLCDFFLIVAQVLKTYNAESAYVPLREWSGHLCPDCGVRVSDDDLTACSRCSSELCFDCSAICARCGDTCCLECVRHCEGCDRLCCDGCLSPCYECQGDSCDRCLTENLCSACRERHSDDDEDGPASHGAAMPPSGAVSSPPETAAPAAAEAQVLADELGQAPLSA